MIRKNRFVPTASLPLTISVNGNVRILGYGNGDSAFTGIERPTNPDAKSFNFNTFNGLAQILIKTSDDNFNFSISGTQLQSFTLVK